MKILFNVTKLLTGALFVFSGLVKLNDPSGFSIKLNEYFDVFAEDVAQKQDSVEIKLQFDFETRLQQNFILYPSDHIKKVQVDINIDSLQGSDINFKWGGMEGVSTHVETLKALPEQIHAFVISSNGSILEKSVSLDSAQQSLTEFQTSLDFDIKHLVKSPVFLSAFFKTCKSYSLYFSIFFCALEVILGLALLLGYEIRITVITTALLIVFFTFLTGYSAYYNKVTDCGCFGDFLKLEPWTSFKKDLILSVCVIVLMLGWKHNRPVFIRNKGHWVVGGLSTITFGFGVYCYFYLPVWDFLPYKKGNDINYIMNHIPEGERASDSIQIRFVMQKGDDSVKVTTMEYADYAQKGYTFIRQDRQLIVEGYKSPIHDFAIYNLLTGEDLKEHVLQSKNYQIVFVMPFLSETNEGPIEELKKIYEWTKNRNIDFYALSSASLEPVKEFKKKHNLSFDIHAADQKMLMTMARYNPTFYLFKGSTVLDKFSGFNMPTISRLEEITGI
jgi:uncharacterized membrane protein YphA (DoxX/SURF4 family)